MLEVLIKSYMKSENQADPSLSFFVKKLISSQFFKILWRLLHERITPDYQKN